MTKNKYMVAAGICAGVLAVSGAGFWAWQAHHDGEKLSSTRSAADADAAARKPSQNVIPLTQTGPAASDTGGLSVTSSDAASSVGQLDGSQRQAAASGGTGAGSSSPSSGIDPKTFGQYDKYQDAAGALFGDAQVGSGAELTAGHKAAVVYRGWLTNGQVFDESKAGSDGKLQPFVFTMGDHQVIPGWEQGLAGMKAGGTRLLIIPPAVGYGAAGQGPIPGNAVLVFQVQLLEVQ